MARDSLTLAKNAYESSTSYVDANYRKKWDDSLRMFQSRHPSDSKYNTETYKHRSKLFRPKTRSFVRKQEAAVAAAFFSNQDVINTEAQNQDDPNQAASAALMKEILQYRLTKTIPWFKILCGGMQDASTVGVVCSYQYWKYSEKEGETTYTPMLDDTGLPVIGADMQPIMVESKSKVVVEDQPCIELIPVENIRFDPGADWTNPAKSSPYLIRMIPMYVTDLKSRMDDTDKTGKKWKKYTDGQIRSSSKNENDQTRQTREQNKQDSTDTGNAPITDYEIVWVHENFVRVDGEEYVYDTLGTEFMLSDPVPLKERYFHGERPIVIGSCMIETHKAMPDSPVMLAENLQREVNEIANQRIDNVKLVLNKRYIVKRGSQVDLKSIVRNVPGSITLANDPIGDVRHIDFPDVTGSSYQEQDRLNVDYDELTGNFSQGSVMTNRKMGETVGGMGMISQAANAVTEYTLRTFTESWVEPVLRQLVKLEQKYETDEVILAIAANKAQLLQKYGISQVTDSMLNNNLALNVNVGMGATDPVNKLNKFIGALGALANVAKMQLPDIDMQQVSKEVFGLAGYRDGARFVKQQDPNSPNEQVIQQAQEIIQQAQQQAGMAMQQAQEQIAKKEHEFAAREQEIAMSMKDIDLALERLDAKQRELALYERFMIENISNEKESVVAAAQVETAQINQLAAERGEQLANAESALLRTAGETSE